MHSTCQGRPDKTEKEASRPRVMEVIRIKKESFKKLKWYLKKESRKDDNLRQIICKNTVKQATKELEEQPEKDT